MALPLIQEAVLPKSPVIVVSIGFRMFHPGFGPPLEQKAYLSPEHYVKSLSQKGLRFLGRVLDHELVLAVGATDGQTGLQQARRSWVAYRSDRVYRDHRCNSSRADQVSSV